MNSKQLLAVLTALLLSLSLTACAFTTSSRTQNRVEYATDTPHYIVGNGEGDIVIVGPGGMYGDGADESEYGLVGTVCTNQLPVRESLSPGSDTLAYLNTGDEVILYAFSHYGEAIWGAIENGWINMEHVALHWTGHTNSFPVCITADKLTLRTGPGTSYDDVGYLLEGDEVSIFQLYNDNGTLWGKLEEGGWICLSYALPLANTELVPGDNADFAPAQNGTDPNGGQNNTGGGNQVNTGGNQNITPVPNNTAIVGTWTEFDADAFFGSCSVSPVSWTFNADGTFSFGTCEYAYFYEYGGWNGASGGWSTQGVYTFDGSTLVLYYQYYYGADPDDYGPEDDILTYTASVNSSTASFGNTTLYRVNDVNEVIRSQMSQKASHYLNTAITGTWTSSNGSSISLSADGTFQATDGSGYYLYAGSNLVLSYTVKDGASSEFLLCYWVSLSGNTMTCSIFSIQYGLIELTYTKT